MKIIPHIRDTTKKRIEDSWMKRISPEIPEESPADKKQLPAND